MIDHWHTVTQPDIQPPMARPHAPRNRLPSGSCDSHAHIFGPADRYPYVASRSYTPHDASLGDYAGLLHHLGFERAVLVQPSVYGTDNRLMADALASTQRVGGDLGIAWRGVAVLDNDVSDSELESLDRLGVRGVRLNLLYQGAEVGFSEAAALAERIAPFGWHLQFLIDITAFDDFAGRLSRLPVESVVDHIGHFSAAKGPGNPAFADLKALMREGRSWVKLSGPNRVSAYSTAPFTDAQRLAEALIEHAPDRLVFGTDWPHVKLSSDMPDDGVLVDELYRWLGDDKSLAERVLVDNPARLYSF